VSHGLIQARSMGDFAIDARDGYRVCPRCGGLKSLQGDVCQRCKRQETAAQKAEQEEAERLRIRRERAPRFEAALRAGWTLEELYREREGPDDDPLPTWEQILARAPDVVIRQWWEKTKEIGR